MDRHLRQRVARQCVCRQLRLVPVAAAAPVLLPVGVAGGLAAVRPLWVGGQRVHACVRWRRWLAGQVLLLAAWREWLCPGVQVAALPAWRRRLVRSQPAGLAAAVATDTAAAAGGAPMIGRQCGHADVAGVHCLWCSVVAAVRCERAGAAPPHALRFCQRLVCKRVCRLLAHACCKGRPRGNRNCSRAGRQGQKAGIRQPSAGSMSAPSARPPPASASSLTHPPNCSPDHSPTASCQGSWLAGPNA